MTLTSAPVEADSSVTELPWSWRPRRACRRTRPRRAVEPVGRAGDHLDQRAGRRRQLGHRVAAEFATQTWVPSDATASGRRSPSRTRADRSAGSRSRRQTPVRKQQQHIKAARTPITRRTLGTARDDRRTLAGRASLLSDPACMPLSNPATAAARRPKASQTNDSTPRPVARRRSAPIWSAFRAFQLSCGPRLSQSDRTARRLRMVCGRTTVPLSLSAVWRHDGLRSWRSQAARCWTVGLVISSVR